MDNILNTITAYRKERNWSLYDLAAHAELKPSTISTWYNDNAIPTIPSLVKICDAFQCEGLVRMFLRFRFCGIVCCVLYRFPFPQSDL